MRSFKVSKAPPLPTWLGNRIATSKAALGHITEELRQPEAGARSDSCRELLHSGRILGTSALQSRVSGPIREVATFSTGGSRKSPGRRRDPALLLGAGWDGGGEDVAVAVWWDFENCNVPLGVEVYKVGVNIVSGLRTCGFKGPVSISAYGDTLQLSRITQEALASTGIRLHHVPSGGKDSSDRALLVDLILWTFEHPPPAHLFLISGDRDFSNALHRLRMMNYNILLACPAGTIVSPSLSGAATQVWQWNSLVRGEGLLQASPPPDFRPPDGSSGGAGILRQSIPKPYSPPPCPGLRGPDGNGPPVDLGGKSAPPLASPSPVSRPKAVEGHPKSFGAAAKPDVASVSPPASLQGLNVIDDKKAISEDSTCPSSKSLLREVPTKVLQQFRNLLVSHPNGILLTDLQKHIFSEKLSIERDFYGHLKIVPFLNSIPQVVQLQRVLMKDNRSWTYLLTATQKTGHIKQQASHAVVENGISTKVEMEQDVQKTLKESQTRPGNPSKMLETPLVAAAEGILIPQSPLNELLEKVALAELSQVSATEQILDTSLPIDCQDPTPEVGAVSASEAALSSNDSDAQVKDLEKETKVVFQLKSESSLPCSSVKASVQVEKLDPVDAHSGDEKTPSKGLHSFLLSLMSIFKRRQRDQVVENSSRCLSQVSSTSVHNYEVGSPDLDQGRSFRPEESPDITVKVEDSGRQSYDSGDFLADGISNRKWMEDGKGVLQGDAAGFEEKVENLSDEGASGANPNLHTQETSAQPPFTEKVAREDSKKSWKTWLFGPTKEKSASPTSGSPIIESSTVVYDLSDLNSVTWKDLLSWPPKPKDKSTGTESEILLTGEPTIKSTKDEALIGKRSSLTPNEQTFDQGTRSREEVWENLKEYLCSAEGTDILSNAPNQMAVVKTLRTTGPHKFRSLQSSQILDLIDQLAKAEEGVNCHLSKEKDGHASRGSGEREAESRQEKIRKHTSQEEVFQNGSSQVMSKVVDERLPEFPSSSTTDLAALKLDRENRSESLPLRTTDSVSESSLSAAGLSTTTVNENGGINLSLEEFQKWFLETIKESYKSSERTRKIGFDLSLVKPDFEREFGVSLDPRAYGFVKVQDLVGTISAVRVAKPRHDMCAVYLLKEGDRCEEEQGGEMKINISKVPLWPQMYHDCKSLVRELMLQNPDGVPGARLKPLFLSRFKYPLDNKRVGYQRMSDLLRLMPDVVSVSGKILVPSEEHLLSLRREAAGEENMRALSPNDGNVPDESLSQSEQDVYSKKAGCESIESWGEIDIEGNGGTPASDDIKEASLSARQRGHDQLMSKSTAGEELFSCENTDALVSDEHKSEEIFEHPKKAMISVEGEFPLVEECQPELLHTEGPAWTSSAGRDVSNLAESEILQSSSEPGVNGLQVDSVVKETSELYSLKPPFNLIERGEGQMSVVRDRDVPEVATLLVIEGTQNRTECGSEDLSKLHSEAALETDIDTQGEDLIKSVVRKGLETESMGSSEERGDVDPGTAARNSTWEPFNNATSFPESLSNKESKGLGGVIGDKPFDTELEAITPSDKESHEDVDGLIKAKNVCSVLKYSCPSMDSVLARSRTTVHDIVSEQSETSESVSDSQPPKGEGSPPSEVSSDRDNERHSTGAEGRNDCCKEGLHSEPSLPMKPTHRSLWKRIFP